MTFAESCIEDGINSLQRGGGGTCTVGGDFILIGAANSVGYEHRVKTRNAPS
jgi:hypothetical protein